MRAVIFANGAVHWTTKPQPLPGPGEVSIQVRMAGICNTDLELLKGYMDFAGIPGHEFVGRVVAAPDHPELLGKRVTAEINLGCGRCRTCLTSGPRHCPHRTTLGIAGKDGAFAEYVTVPASAVHMVPDGVSDREAVFIEPLAAALEPGQQLHLTADTSVLVLGDGKLGILAACSLRLQVPDIVLAGRHPRKLAIAAAQGVATRHGDIAGLREAFGRFDVVVEATGRPDGLACALDLVRPEGTVVLKTTTFAPTPVDMARVVVDEISLVGSRCGNFRLATSVLGHRLVDVAPLIEAVHPFDAFPEALAAAARPGAMKVLVEF
ncbi:Alcohol dehydrogenase GroES domain protein [Solidesulfovibrio carbinoliphilus subsp. oakridgensis]|uniref:Alcohol dehydrogenase GroES domain protein n=1 Tax=Solidesulfovibrio carbinoliphilus subsp. oakridgensis TaxID=694327 RepID=G7QE33_9BACT|nr:alcohol dehydrogenase catalytic domain-containing protein [Solidesulfovibrio carbinoliphilus]EHJ46689.1 Alcohol dehydrogenase GroES domain protein [Solidesulfovibrio carbinoliphilus subsp. oakridgensis]